MLSILGFRIWCLIWALELALRFRLYIKLCEELLGYPKHRAFPRIPGNDGLCLVVWVCFCKVVGPGKLLCDLRG